MAWDRAVSLDLGDCEAMTFRFLCTDEAPVSYFAFYLKSGAGWYAGRFGTGGRKGWVDVRIDKSEMNPEGSPAGWDRISAVRISAWRAGARDTDFYVSRFRVAGRDAQVAIVRADSVVAAHPSEAKSVANFTRNVAGHFKSLGVPYRTIGDTKLTAGSIAGVRVIVLPHNSSVPAPALGAIKRFLQSGGKLICFYALPAGLEPLVGIQRGEHTRQAYPGQFASIQGGSALRGLPARVSQNSWNIYRARPVTGRSRVAGTWHDGSGKSTGMPAILVSDNCILMTHVLTSDDPEKKQRMILAMAGHFLPGLWKDAAQTAIERIGVFGPYVGASVAVADIRRRAGGKATATAALSRVDGLTRAAAEAAAAGDHVGAVASAQAARQALMRAYCATQRPRPGEWRAFWCHDPFGSGGKGWDSVAEEIAGNGFTAVIANLLWGGTAYYPSEILPVSGTVQQKGDQVRECLRACRKYGLECHVWKVNWNMGTRASQGFMARMKREGRTQVDADGTALAAWLCPSHPANRELEINSMVEIARRYAVDGLHFDYIRYPGAHACFCKGCRKRFEGVTGRPVAKWPADVRTGKRLQEWLDFRRSSITAVVQAVSREARRVRPGIRISAAVFPDWEVQRDSIAQDWRAWCRAGYLDFVCPMDYTENTVRFENMVRSQKAWAGRVPVYPGIGLSTWGAGDRVCTLIDQVGVTRRLGCGGFTVFEYNEAEAREILPLCGLGLTAGEGE